MAKGYKLSHLGLCPTSGKRSYESRKDANRARRELGERALRAYKCGDCPWWHVGHLPYDVRRGLVTCEDVYGPRA